MIFKKKKQAYDGIGRELAGNVYGKTRDFKER